MAGTPANTRLSRLAASRQAVRLLILACPAWLAGFLVLHLAGASTSLMRQQALATGAACLLAGCGSALAARFSRLSIAAGVAAATLVGLALPLGAATNGPHRWLAISRLQVYVAPLLLPACVSAWTVLAARHGRVAWLVHLSTAATALVLAAQPDASQALALLLALAVGVARVRPIRTPLLFVLGFAATCTVLAFLRPDPLQPVPHVEGVFALAASRSLAAGATVAACALLLVGGLVAWSAMGMLWLLPVAVYYATLYACSLAGLTPAPLIGYGAGPTLGVGLLALMRPDGPAVANTSTTAYSGARQPGAFSGR